RDWLQRTGAHRAPPPRTSPPATFYLPRARLTTWRTACTVSSGASACTLWPALPEISTRPSGEASAQRVWCRICISRTAAAYARRSTEAGRNGSGGGSPALPPPITTATGTAGGGSASKAAAGRSERRPYSSNTTSRSARAPAGTLIAGTGMSRARLISSLAAARRRERAAVVLGRRVPVHRIQVDQPGDVVRLERGEQAHERPAPRVRDEDVRRGVPSRPWCRPSRMQRLLATRPVSMDLVGGYAMTRTSIGSIMDRVFQGAQLSKDPAGQSLVGHFRDH